MDMNFRRLPPAVAWSPSERCFIPRRNVPSPPSTVNRIVNTSFIGFLSQSAAEWADGGGGVAAAVVISGTPS